MKRYPVLAALLLPALLTLATPAQAQSPRIDPSFLPTNVYRPATASAALQLRDGSRVVAGNFTRAEGQPQPGLVRYLPSGVPDAAFNAAVAARVLRASELAEAANGKVLVVGSIDIGGGRPLAQLARLNADGTVDTTFRMPVRNANGAIMVLRVLADGNILLGGNLDFLGLPGSVGLARLQADGRLDTSFQPRAVGGSIAVCRVLAPQADGKLVLSAYVVPAGGQNGSTELLRLNPDGSPDATFQPPALAAGREVGAIAVQPDGQLLLASADAQPLLAGGSTALVRLSAAGVPDATFAPDATLRPAPFYPMPTIAVRPDGRIVLAPQVNQALPGRLPVTQLLPSGAYDPAFAVPTVPEDIFPTAVALQVLPGGQVLVAGNLLRLGNANGLTRGAALLSNTGQPEASFAPLLQQSGAVRDVTQQPDGRLVAVGDFTEVNGVAVRQIARFQADGQLDTTFCRLARLTGGLPTRVLAQPDGTVLVGGAFAAVGGSSRPALARLLPSGQPDAAFAPPLLAAVGTTSGSSVNVLARQPDGAVLAGGSLRSASGTSLFQRFSATGQPDASFQTGLVIPTSLLVQPDGNIVVGEMGPQPLRRLLPNGSADPTFMPPVMTVPSGALRVTALERYADGRLLLAGRFAQVGGVATTHIARLLPNGAVDANFASQLLPLTGNITSIAIQPNERVLLSGSPQFIPTATTNSVFRLLPDGSADASFDITRGPVFGTRNLGTARVLVQADGAIVAAGAFETVAGLPIGGLVRLLDPNVLHVRAGQAATQLQAWPVPAHETLHVSWAASTPARQVQLLDNLGRVVRMVNSPAPGLRLPTAGLAPGVYLLRVEYAAGVPALRRIVVE